MDRGLLQQLVRLRINERRLPQGRAIGLRWIAGDGQPCDGCGEPLRTNEKAVIAMVSLEWMSIRFHEDCYDVWDAERAALFGEMGHAAS